MVKITFCKWSKHWEPGYKCSELASYVSQCFQHYCTDDYTLLRVKLDCDKIFNIVKQKMQKKAIATNSL